MPSANTRHQRPPDSDSLEQLYEQVHDYVVTYWRHMLVVVLAIIVALMGYQSWRNRLRAEEARTWRRLGELPALNALMFRRDSEKQQQQIIETCKEILGKRWQTSATPWVLLKLANAQLASKRLGAARETLQRLNRDYSDHYATRMATKAQATLLEDLRRYKEAAALYTRMAKNADEHSPFWLDAGRARELAGDKEGALAAYEKLLKTAQNGNFPEARFRYKLLAGDGPMLSPPPEPPAPPKPAETGSSPESEGLPLPGPEQAPSEEASPRESQPDAAPDETDAAEPPKTDRKPDTTSDEG
jgi:tetratricopeptide (TPR) repeat protein